MGRYDTVVLLRGQMPSRQWEESKLLTMRSRLPDEDNSSQAEAAQSRQPQPSRRWRLAFAARRFSEERETIRSVVFSLSLKSDE